MHSSYPKFLIGLYEEYLEEASFLYNHRRALLGNPEITWTKIGEFEQRLEAHIDGLVVGDKLALDVCVRRAAEGDFGELYAAVSVFCRQNRRESVLAICDQLDPDDTERAVALADALKYELPNEWVVDFATLLVSGDVKLAPILARVFGYRRLSDGAALSNVVKRCATSALAEIVWALGRSGCRSAKEPLLDYLRSEEPPTRTAAAIALARMGEASATEYCVDQAQSASWPIAPLGLAGGREALAVFSKGAEGKGKADFLMALGLLGDPGTMPLLISHLEEAEVASSAATALQCVTGAGIYENVFVPEEIEEDELFDSEREELRQGKIPNRGDGRPYGSAVTRLCRDPEVWEQWWSNNCDRFSTGIRYRNGRPYSPAVLVDMLAAESTPYSLRESCLEELAIRYGYDAGFEVDSPVAQQLSGLAKAEAWSRSNGRQFQEGAYYFGGRLQH